MARPNQKLVRFMEAFMEFSGASANSLQTALAAASGEADEEPAPKKRPAASGEADEEPAPKKRPAAKRQPDAPDFLTDLVDVDLVDLAAAVLEIESSKVQRVLDKSGREAIYKKLLSESTEDDLQEAVDALFEDEDEDDDGDDDFGDDDDDFDGGDDGDDDFGDDDDDFDDDFDD